jgi:hypothetical protein
MKLKIKFVDFADDFDDKNNFFLNLLKRYMDIEISDNPDIVFYSNFGYEHLKYRCKRVFYSGENIAPNYYFCDYSFSFKDTDERNFFLPHFVEYEYFFDFKSSEVKEYQDSKKDKFCSFMASNYKAKDRINFVKELMERKKVDCLGPVLYNMTDVENIGKQESSGEYKDWRKEKLDTIKGYKFTIAFENEQSYNYVTEKIYQPLVVGSIPIYWGAPNVNELFNQKCFINVNNFSSYKEAIDEIIKIDEDDEYYKTFFEEEAILIDLNEEKIINRINEIISSSCKTTGKRHYISHRILYYVLNTKYNVLKKLKSFIKKFIT